MSHAVLRRHGPVPVWLLVAILVALSFWGPYAHLLGGATNLAPLYAFLAGLLLQSGGTLPSDASQSALPPLRATLVASAAFVVMFIVAVRKQTAVTIAVETLCASALIYTATFGPRALAALRPFDLDVMRFYGRISYSFYLLHVIGLALAAGLLPSQQQPVMRAVSLLLAALLITTPAAWLMWRFVEMPLIEIGRRRLVTKPA
jgi:peptidoglycan/LPS O-acetylase OafA/YrhL